MKRQRLTFSLLLMTSVWLMSLPVAMAQSPSVAKPKTPTGLVTPVDDSSLPTKKTKLDFQKHGGIVYMQGTADGEDYELKLDVYVPEGEGPFPAILAVHGGSWTSGTKLHLLRHAWRMAARGYVVVAINYRHAPKHKFPCQIHDCKQAVRWIRHNASEFKIDPERIGAYGYSAGGHLVSLLGTTDAEDGLEGEVDEPFKSYSTQIKAVVVGGAPCEFEWAGSRTLAFWIGATKDQRPELYTAAAPITYIDQGDPPFYLYHGESDLLVPLSSTQKMRDQLRAANVSCTHQVVKRKGHFATFSDFRQLDRAIDFFDATLQNSTGKDGALDAKDN